MKRKWWLTLAAGLIALICVFGFREALLVRFFPKLVLSRAIPAAFTELEARFTDSPVHLIGSALDPAGCEDMHMKLDTKNLLLGAVHYDLELHTQTSPNRICGEGSVCTGGGLMDVKLYLDENFAALSSDSLTGGAFYGIAYETFPEDIRQFPLLSLLMGEETLAQWDTSVGNLAAWMGTSLSLPEISDGDIRKLLLGALVLKPQVTAEEGKHCYAVAFTATGLELAEKAEPYQDKLPESLKNLLNSLKTDPDSRLELVFHLEKRQLRALDVSLRISGTSYDARISGAEDQFRGELTHWDGKNLERSELTVQTASDAETYREKLVLLRTVNGVQNQLSGEYVWDLSSGDMALEVLKDGKKHPIRLNLKGEGETLTITCQEFEKLSRLLFGKENASPAICTLTVSPGNPVAQVEDYKNISQWSMEDLYLLLKRLGGLVGIHLP